MNTKLFKKTPEPTTLGVPIEEDLTDEQKRERARKNWGILRDHIKQMKNKVNFLVTTLDEANEAKQQQNMNGFDVVDRSGNYNDKGIEQTGKSGSKKCIQQIIIFPA